MFKILKELNLAKLFIFAILLRVLLMPFYFHPDIKTYNYQTSFLKKGVFNIYTYLVNNREYLPLKEEFVYFPLTYFSIGAYQTLVTPILGPDFNSWLADASEEARNRVGTFRYLFILKLPYLTLDLITPFLLIKFLEDKRLKRDAFILWLFNPFSILIIYVFSNVDIFPVIFSLVSLLLFKKRKFLQSGLTLALAAGFKFYPMLFLPFMLIFVKDIKDKLKLFFSSVGILFLMLIPFFSPAFFSSALVSGLTTRIILSVIGLGFGESLMIGVVVLSALFFIGITYYQKTIENVWVYCLLALLFIFSSIHFHIQWLLWIMPFAVILSVSQKREGKLIWIWLTLASLIPFLYEDKSMSVSLLSGVSSLYNLLPTPFLIIQRLYDPYILQSIIHSILFGLTMVIFIREYKYLKT